MLRNAIVLLVVVVIARLVFLVALDVKGRKGDLLTYDKLPSHYLFLLFPKKDCEHIRSAGTKCPKRAVLVAKDEFDLGVIHFAEEKDVERTINAAALEFLPNDNAEAMLRNWYTVLPDVSNYSSAEWTKTVLSSGTSEIKLTLDDAQHARKDRFVYFVSNGKVVGAKSAVVVGVFELIIFTVLGIVAAGIIWKIISKLRNRTKSGT